MQLTYVAVVVLASMVFVLSGMIGYLYWQQTKILQQIQSLAIVISSQFVPRMPPPEPESEQEEEAGVEAELEVKTEPDVKVEDDRLTVDDSPVEHVSGPPADKKAEVDIDDLDSKTAAQLRDILTQRGIPFGKRDAKTVLVQLLKAAG
jgi:hypothetical protein